MNQIVQNVYKKNFDQIKSSLSLQSHKTEIKSIYQMSYIDYIFSNNDCLFMKLFKIIDNKPYFYTYGFLYNNRFVIDKSNVNAFKYSNLNVRISKRRDNDCYLIVVGDSDCYLLYNPYPNAVDKIFVAIKKDL